MVDSVDALVPASSRGVRSWGRRARFLFHDAWVGLRHGKALKVRGEQHAFAHARRARVIPIELNRLVTERLIAKSREERTTVHGALAAAMLLGTLHDAQVAQASVTFGSPVNIRAQLEPPVGEQVGFYIAMVSFRSLVSAQMPFWDLARAVRRQLEHDLARSSQLAVMGLLPVMLRLIGGNRLTPRELVERWERWIPTTTGLTNLGRLGIETSHGALKIEECHFAASPSALGDFLATATCLEGRLFWNFIWPDPGLTQAHANALVARIVKQVHQAVE